MSKFYEFQFFAFLKSFSVYVDSSESLLVSCYINNIKVSIIVFYLFMNFTS